MVEGHTRLSLSLSWSFYTMASACLLSRKHIELLEEFLHIFFAIGDSSHDDAVEKILLCYVTPPIEVHRSVGSFGSSENVLHFSFQD